MIPVHDAADVLDYDRGESADWRRAADDRIDRHRKADLGIRVLDDDRDPVPNAELRVVQRAHEFPFGSAVDARTMMADDDGEQYRAVVSEWFDRATFENDLKWGWWEEARSDPDRMDTLRDAMDWLADRDVEIRGHYVHWGVMEGGSLPPHVTDEYDGDAESLRTAWLENVESRVPAAADLAEIPQWDVINHPVGWSEDLRTTEDVLGTEFYQTVIERARELVPDAELWINEGSVLSGREREDAYERVISDLIDAGTAPDGIGFMGHFQEGDPVPPGELYDVLERFAGRIPNLQITELDVELEDDAAAAAYFRDVLRTAFSHPAMDGIVLWGFWAGRHWRPDAALYDEAWQLTPIGTAWEELVFEEWWTDEAGTTDGDGEFSTRGVRGEYDLEISHEGTTVEESVTLPADGRTVEMRLDG